MSDAIDNVIEAPDWAWDLAPTVLPPGWKRHNDERGLRYTSGDGLLVIFTAAEERDGKRWIHVSASRASRLPGWQDMKNVKDIFIGPKRLAVQVFPRKDEYVNVHPFVLHLWSCLDGDPVPDFRRRGVI